MLSFSILTVLIKIKNETARMKCGIRLVGLDFEINDSICPRTEAQAKQDNKMNQNISNFPVVKVFFIQIRNI